MEHVYLFATESHARRFQQAADHMEPTVRLLGTAALVEQEQPGAPTALDQVRAAYDVRPDELPLYAGRVEPVTVARTGHERRANSAGRQTCCQVCHDCGTELRPVLDGELWCPTCECYW
jgi:hypothetical protein